MTGAPSEIGSDVDGFVLPREAVRDGLRRHRGIDSVTWLGHACFLIRLGGRTILTDPFLGDYAAPIEGFGPRRFTPPALRLRDLPPPNVVLISQWSDRRESDQHIKWCRETYAALRPHLGTFRYVNYLADDEAGDPVAAAYGPNYQRLRALKAKYDPDKFFHTNVNITPLHR